MIVLVFTVTACGCTESESQITNVAKYKNILELSKVNIVTLDTSVKGIKVEATYTNINNKPLYALSPFGTNVSE